MSAAAGRPRLTAKGHRTRTRIVEAAAGLMFEHGVAGTTLGDVQTAAGVGSSQLYHYFQDKNDLVRAVIAHQGDGVIGPQEAMLQPTTGLAGLRAWADAVVEMQERMHCRGGCPIGSLGSELAESDPDARFEVAAAFERWSAAIREHLRGLHAAGVLRPEARPDDLALALLAAVQGGLLLGQVQRTTRPLQVALDGAVSLVEQHAAHREGAVVS